MVKQKNRGMKNQMKKELDRKDKKDRERKGVKAKVESKKVVKKTIKNNIILWRNEPGISNHAGECYAK